MVPSDVWVLLVGVPIDPLIVQRSVGENSGSLIGPLGTKGVKIAEGDWSIPRFWRYNCIQNRHRAFTLNHMPYTYLNTFHIIMYYHNTIKRIGNIQIPEFVLRC